MGGSWLHFRITTAQSLQVASEGNSAEDFVAETDFHIKRLKQRHDNTNLGNSVKKSVDTNRL